MWRRPATFRAWSVSPQGVNVLLAVTHPKNLLRLFFATKIIFIS